MNPSRYQGGGGGPTGSIHRAGVGGVPPLNTDKKWGDTTSKPGEVSRIFVGNIDFKTTNCGDIEQRFSKYGLIKGIDINSNGFAFVQYDRVEEAQNACQHENGFIINNRTSDVRMFDKSSHPLKGRSQPFPGRDRSRSPLTQRGPTGGPTGTRRGSAISNSSQFDDQYGYPPPPPPAQPLVGNDAEIIVVNKEQWNYAELIERRIRHEAGIQYIDMLFLHNPSALNLTLNDLFERRTLYAIVVTQVNEDHKSLTLHVLHNQTEHRNMPLDDALQLIAKDFRTFGGQRGPPPPSQPTSNYSGDDQYNPFADNYNRPLINESVADSNKSDSSMKLPEEISYLLKTVIQENGPQFLSLQQIDSIIDYFTHERNRLTSKAQTFQQSGSGPSTMTGQSADFDKQRTILLDNPHVQAALSSLLQIGALNNSMNKSDTEQSVSNNNNNQSNNMQMSGQYGGQQAMHPMLSRDNNFNHPPPRRHSLLGTELGNNKPQVSIPGAPGGLVRYPPPQSYSQYGIN